MIISIYYIYTDANDPNVWWWLQKYTNLLSANKNNAMNISNKILLTEMICSHFAYEQSEIGVVHQSDIIEIIMISICSGTSKGKLKETKGNEERI